MNTRPSIACIVGVITLALAADACSEHGPDRVGATVDAGTIAEIDLDAEPMGEAAGASGALAAFDAPDTSAALLPFLEAGGYAKWESEPAFHSSSGPHGGNVRVFYGPLAAAALSANRHVFPAGAATIKEAVSTDGTLLGWSVWVKVQDESDAGSGFYWYEVVRRSPADSVYADGRGSTACVGCHARGVDFLLSTRPFQ